MQRGVDEVKVMVRYPRADREMTSSLANMFIRTPEGTRYRLRPWPTRCHQGLLKPPTSISSAPEVTAGRTRSWWNRPRW